MKFISFAVCLVAAQAAIVRFKMMSVSSSGAVDGSPISYLSEGDDIDYLFITSPGSVLFYDDHTHFLGFNDSHGVTHNFSVQDNIPFFSSKVSQPVTFDTEDYLVYNGTNFNFFACKNIDDPHNYSDTSYAITYYKDLTPPPGCQPVRLKK